MTPSTPHREHTFPLRAVPMDHVIPQKTRSHPRARMRSSPRNRRATPVKNRLRASNFDALLAGSRLHRPPLRCHPRMLQRHLLVPRVVPTAIDRSRMRKPQRQHRLAHSRSHRPHTTRSRVSLSHRTCQRCHLGCHRIGGTLLAEDIPKRRPRL
jgi:hypothetical protein